MPLLLVVLGPDETPLLTLAEWDELIARPRVLFERESHPLQRRLDEQGIAWQPLAEEVQATDQKTALVADPGSPRLVELARSGARVLSGAGSAPDDLSAAHAASISRRAAASLGTAATVMARLRSKDGCPWDLEQDHRSLGVHLVEEAYEVLDAIDRGAFGEDLEDELGDLLLQVLFHAQLAADDGRFDIAGVAGRLAAKLVRRHPHVFGDSSVGGSAEVVRNWESIKGLEKKEKEKTGPFDDIPAALPALLYAFKVQKKAAGVGFAPSESEAVEQVERALRSVKSEGGPEGLGDLLFWIVALARARGADPEGALRARAARFRDSF